MVAIIYYLKPKDTASIKTHGKYYHKSPKENIIYKIIHGKNYEKLFKLLFKTMEINIKNLS